MEIVKFLQTISNSLSEERKKISELTKQENQTKESAVFLFFSFDLSGSTIFKVEHPGLWASVFSCFYTQILKRLISGNYDNEDAKNNEGICMGKLWKLIGDEVLIYFEITKLKQLYQQIIIINKILGNIMDDIVTNVGEDIANRDDSILQEEVRDIILSKLGINVTAWVAECSRKNYRSSNIIYDSSTNFPNEYYMDFLGRDIDEGFRMAKYAAKNKIIVSPLLAWLIWKTVQDDEDNKKIVDSNFKITSFVPMKGVWRGRKVPVIMFNQHFSELVEILEYDELESETFANVRKVGYKDFINDARFEIKRIDSILENVHRKKEAEQTYNKLLNMKCEKDVEKLTYTLNKQEFHIACMIFAGEDKILIHKDHERGYEFGCIKKVMVADKGSWKSYCEREYDKKYGIKIKVDECPVPIATYLYDKKNALGLILMAEYDGKEEDIQGDWTLKSEEDIMNINEKMVDLFKENVKRAIQIRKLRKGDY